MLRAMFWIGWLAAAWADVPAVHSAEGAAGKDAVGNRLGYLEAFCDPFYPGLGTARLATPQWVGA
ncbi:MAG TPA: hypothetical protein PK777_17060, partial [Thermoguttaceae bacterium]|nr:hypothetical protein [Thermoguttaceae bacterium]